MNILLVLLPVSLVLLGVAIWSFFWAVNKGQFDDLDTPALRILEDDPPRAARPLSPDAAHAQSDGDDARTAGDDHENRDDARLAGTASDHAANRRENR